MDRLMQLAVNAEGFVFDPAGGEMFTVNKTGLGIIKGLQERKSDGMIADQLGETYGMPPEQVEKDIFDFKSQLRLFKLI